MMEMIKGSGIWGLHLSNPIGQKIGYLHVGFLLAAVLLLTKKDSMNIYIPPPTSEVGILMYFINEEADDRERHNTLHLQPERPVLESIMC